MASLGVGLDGGVEDQVTAPSLETCPQGHTKWIEGFFHVTLGVYKDDNIFGTVVGDKPFYSRITTCFSFYFT